MHAKLHPGRICHRYASDHQSLHLHTVCKCTGETTCRGNAPSIGLSVGTAGNCATGTSQAGVEQIHQLLHRHRQSVGHAWAAPDLRRPATAVVTAVMLCSSTSRAHVSSAPCTPHPRCARGCRELTPCRVHRAALNHSHTRVQSPCFWATANATLLCKE